MSADAKPEMKTKIFHKMCKVCKVPLIYEIYEDDPDRGITAICWNCATDPTLSIR